MNKKIRKKYRPHIAFVAVSALIIASATLYGGVKSINSAKNTAENVEESEITEVSEVQMYLSSSEQTVQSAQVVVDAAPTDTVYADTSEDTSESEKATEIAETPEQVRERRIAEVLSQMTAREKLGQMFMISYSDNAEEVISEYSIGSVIFFASDFENDTPASILEKTTALQALSKYGVLTAVDEEGGTVTRISRFTQYRSEKFLSPRTLYSWGGMDYVRSDAAEKSALLSSLGINLNMAPVADISTDESDFMYWRSVGLDANGTSEFVKTVIAEARSAGIGSVAKHFPGYGSVADTHTGMAYDYRTLDELRARDFVPFSAAIDAGVEAILVSHIITTSIDSEKPASISEKTVSLLRNELGYDGVIMTDDLAMSGITDYCTTGNAALEAILAGCDLLCCTNRAEQYPLVWSAVENGTITEERLNESAARVLRMKYNMGLWE